jgi:hypothetical protein
MEDKNNEELEIIIKKKTYYKIYKITKITLGSTRNQSRYIKNYQKINCIGTMFIKSSGKTKIEMAGPSRRGFTEDESEKLEREV